MPAATPSSEPAGPWAEVRTVEQRGLVLDVRTAGPADGDPLVLLHGFPQSSRSWGAVVDRLRATQEGRRLHLVAPDQRGYSPGARPDEVGAYATPHLVSDVLVVADALGLETFHLAGHDWGASVAWAVAARHPGRVRTLTALSIPHLAAFGRALAEDPDQRRRSAYIRVFRRPGVAEERLLADGGARLRRMFAGQVPAADVEAYVALMAEGALTPALRWYRAMDRDLGALPPVRVPTTFVWGEEDLATAESAAVACGEHVRADYRFVRLPGVGHWTPDQVPGTVADELLARVRTVGRSA